MVESIIILSVILLAATIIAATEYYRRVIKARKEYKKAKDVLEDLVLSFSRELKREADKLGALAVKVDSSLPKIGTIHKRIETIEKKNSPWENQSQAVLQNLEGVIENVKKVSFRINEIENSNQILKSKIIDLENQVGSLSAPPEILSESVIPIRRERAIAPLTDTELKVLEMLSEEGPKTAPETRMVVKLSREHTARLMKKLYEKGYIERETSKIPFKYSVKKEMEKLLKKSETLSP
ncbi:MarR family transcriptional regulator [Candidatus Bathyarchaeota archaeon]|nr:MarR family transcriptional regulator [Candidatus Bathyarchaeota archaeon]